MSKKSNTGTSKTKYIPIATAVLIFAAINVFFFQNGFDVESILNYTPENTVLAILFMLVLYALKSISVVFPLDILYVADGILFSPVSAVLVSVAGVFVAVTIPYVIGKVCGENLMKEIYEKYPKAEKLAVYQNENPFFASFITRIVGVLPLDVVSAYFGAHSLNYGIFVLGSISGLLINLVITTLLGNRLSNPSSAEFMMVIALKVVVSAGAIYLKYLYDKKKEYK